MKKQWKPLLWAAVVGLLLVWTAHTILKAQSPSALLSALAQVRPLLLLPALALMGLYLCCEAGCTHRILSALGSPAPFRRCLAYSCVGFYFSTITPSATGGQPMQVCYMARDGIPGAHGTLDMLMITICYQLVSALYALAAFLFFPQRLTALGSAMALMLWVGLGVTLLLTAGMILLLLRPYWGARPVFWLAGRLEHRGLARPARRLRLSLERQVRRYAQGALLLRAQPGLLPGLLGLTALQLGALYLVPYAIYFGLGLTGYGPLELAATQAMLTVAVAFLPLPGGMGAAEAVFLQAFSLFFGGMVAPAMILSRGVSCYGTLLATGLVLLSLHLRRRGRQPHPASLPSRRMAA